MKSLDIKSIVTELEKTIQCNCNLDSWEPQHDTGHTWVCNIHKTAKEKLKEQSQ